MYYIILRWKLANDNGNFAAEMAPITLKTRKGEQIMDTDEHPKQTSLEQIAKLPPVFKKNGTVNAGNASVSYSIPIIGSALKSSLFNRRDFGQSR